MSELRHAEEQANLLGCDHPQRHDRYAQGRRLSSAGALSCRGAMSWGRPAYGRTSKSNPVRSAHSRSATATTYGTSRVADCPATAHSKISPRRWAGRVLLLPLLACASRCLPKWCYTHLAGFLMVSCPDLVGRRSSCPCARTRRQSPPAEGRSVAAVGDRCCSGGHRSWNSGGRRPGALPAGRLELPAGRHRADCHQEHRRRPAGG